MMYDSKQYLKSSSNSTMWIILILLAILYPLFVSIYVVIPSLIGFAGYGVISGIRDEKWMQVFVSSLYLLMFDINTSTPVFIGLTAALLSYLLILPRLRIISTCKICTAVIMVISVYSIYVMTTYLIDFVFELDIAHADILIFISMLADIFLVALI